MGNQEKKPKAELKQAMEAANAQAMPQPSTPAVGTTATNVSEKDSTLRLIAFIFALLSTIGLGILLIPLSWMIPMTVITYKIYKGEKRNTVAFGVCTLIFVNLISGILLLCSKKDN